MPSTIFLHKHSSLRPQYHQRRQVKTLIVLDRQDFEVGPLHLTFTQPHISLTLKPLKSAGFPSRQIILATRLKVQALMLTA